MKPGHVRVCTVLIIEISASEKNLSWLCTLDFFLALEKQKYVQKNRVIVYYTIL